MTRRLVNLLTIFSLLACLPVLFLWTRRGSGILGFEMVTRRGTCWELYSGHQWVGIQHTSGWPEAPGRRSNGYAFAKGPRERSLACLVYTGATGAHCTQRRALGLTLGTGGVSILVDSNGTVERGPPYAPGFITPQRLSSPRPFWYLNARHEAALIVLAVLPTLRLTRAVRGRIRARLLRRRGLCVACAYDLTGNVSGVCPECGKVVGAGVPPSLELPAR